MISTIIPAYNEASAIEAVVKEYLPYSDEIVIIDDGSTDETSRIIDGLAAEESSIVVCHHDENRGKAQALRTGIERATGDIIVFTDADKTYPAEYVPDLVQKVSEDVDLVLGNRLAEGGNNIPMINRIGNRILSMFVSFVGGVGVSDAQTGMRAMRHDIFEELDAMGTTGLEFETKMTVRAAKMGYSIEEVPIKYRERVGESHLHPVRDGYKMFHSILDFFLRESSPILRMAIVASTLLFLAGLYTGMVSLINTLQTGFVQHQFYPLLTVFFYITGFQILTVTLMAEHIKHRIRRVEDRLK